MSNARCFWSLCASLLLTIHVANAQTYGETSPTPDSTLQRQQQQRQQLRQQMETQTWVPSLTAAQPVERQRLPVEQPCRTINQIIIQGNLASNTLYDALSGPDGGDPAQGKCLGSTAITMLIQRVQEALLAQGFITSQVAAPEQDMSTGVLVLEIREGRIAKLRPKHKDTHLPKLAWAFATADVLKLQDIEQSSDNLQRLQSWHPQFQIEPGETAGTSDVIIDLEASRPIRISLQLDDNGSKTTGKNQGNATLSWDNPLGLADMFYVTQGQDLGDRAPGPRGSDNQIIHYSLPWGYWLLSTTASHNVYHQTVFGPYQSYLYRGNSRQKELALQRVVHRNGTSKTTAALKTYLRQSSNYIDDLEVQVQRRRTAGWEASIQHQQYFASGTLAAQLAYRRGTGAFNAQPAPEESIGLGQARMQVINGQLHWTTSVYNWQYSSLLQWQWRLTPLTAQDRFCVGSRSTVRGFDGQQTLCGDQGQLWRQELAATIHTAPLTLQPYVALDGARTSTPGLPPQTMSSAALGLRSLVQRANHYFLHLDFFVGKPLSRPEGFANHTTTGMNIRAEF